MKRQQKSKVAAKTNKVATIFRFSYRISRLNYCICSKIFIVNFKLIGHIDQQVSADFEHFFSAGLLYHPKQCVYLTIWHQYIFSGSVKFGV